MDDANVVEMHAAHPLTLIPEVLLGKTVAIPEKKGDSDGATVEPKPMVCEMGSPNPVLMPLNLVTKLLQQLIK